MISDDQLAPIMQERDASLDDRDFLPDTVEMGPINSSLTGIRPVLGPPPNLTRGGDSSNNGLLTSSLLQRPMLNQWSSGMQSTDNTFARYQPVNSTMNMSTIPNVARQIQSALPKAPPHIPRPEVNPLMNPYVPQRGPDTPISRMSAQFPSIPTTPLPMTFFQPKLRPEPQFTLTGPFPNDELGSPIDRIRTPTSFPNQGGKKVKIFLKSERAKVEKLLTFKTEKCQNSDGHNWKRCPYSHGLERSRRNPAKISYSTRYCCYYDKSKRDWICPRGDACRYAHSKEEDLHHPLKFRTSPCMFTKEHCIHDPCPFYHDRPSVLKDSPNLKGLLLLVTELADSSQIFNGVKELVLTDAELEEFRTIVSGHPPKITDKCDLSRSYLRAWLRGYYESVIATTGNKVSMDRFYLMKAYFLLHAPKPQRREPFQRRSSIDTNSQTIVPKI